MTAQNDLIMTELYHFDYFYSKYAMWRNDTPQRKGLTLLITSVAGCADWNDKLLWPTSCLFQRET